MNTLREEIKKLEYLLEQKKVEQKAMEYNCRHDFTAPVYDPETLKEFIFTHFEGRGSDPIAKGYYVDKYRPRWSRECRHCGLKQYTYERRPIEYEPVFK